MFKNHRLTYLFFPWAAALLALFLYYHYIQFPRQRAFIHAVQLLQHRDYLNAEKELDAIIRDNPFYAPAYANLWYLDLEQGNHVQARQDFNRMLGIHLQDGEMHTPRGIMYGRLRNPKDAVIFYDHLVAHGYALNFLNNESF